MTNGLQNTSGKIVLIIIATNKIKYIRLAKTKQVKDNYDKNYKILKMIAEDGNISHVH